MLGYANRAASEVNLPACDAAKIGVFRRFSGGGTVLQGPGCLNYSVILRIPDSVSPASPLQSITGTNQFVMRRHQQALQSLLRATVEIQGHTDLTLLPPLSNLGPPHSCDSQPPAPPHVGQAARLPSFISLPSNSPATPSAAAASSSSTEPFSCASIFQSSNKFLPPPSQQPAYRKSRPHEEFLTNLNLDSEPVKKALRRAWSATEPLAEIPTDAIVHLVRTKYSNPAWNLKL